MHITKLLLSGGRIEGLGFRVWRLFRVQDRQIDEATGFEGVLLKDLLKGV